MNAPFTLAADGDVEERRYWPLFIEDRFPSYEQFWSKRIVPLTERVRHRGSIGFLTTHELAQAGFGDGDVAIAQLHYTLLLHLGRAFDLLDGASAFTHSSHLPNRPFDRHAFFECFTRLSGASDVADELLARSTTPGRYAPWSESDGRNARLQWRKSRPDQLRPVRAYRNRLVHGRVVPELWVDAHDATGRVLGRLLFYPRLNRVDTYLDWRVAFAPRAKPGPGSAVADTGPPPDFDEAALIVRDAWQQAVGYVEAAWATHLIPIL